MIGPSIEPSEVGLSGLVWLFLSYGYVLYFASNLISEGSELLLLVPSLAGLVGGVVLPLLGAVPDGAIIFFSGLGSLDKAQQTLSVGVGALAGSTVMLLTIPFALSVYGGRVDLQPNGLANYFGKPKVTPGRGLSETGVALTEAVQHGGVIMMLTTLPYFLIQVPALFMHGPTQEVAAGEHWWAASAFLVCLSGLVIYMRIQLRISREGEDRGKRTAVLKKLLQKGRVSLSGAIASRVRETMRNNAAAEYQSLSVLNDESSPEYPPPAIAEYLKEILVDAYMTYDSDRNGMLDQRETFTFFRDLHESISDTEMFELFARYDTDKSGFISLDEFIGVAYALIKTQDAKEAASESAQPTTPAQVTRTSLAETAFAEVEEEEVPEDFTDLPPDQQQAAIKKRAFGMLLAGTALVVFFSDPMVDVMQEIAVRANLPPFYVSFILAPLASNASEVLASQYYASKKTSKTITVALTALEGAASMNNTFCLSIFMGLIFFRGLAWQYTAETIAIVVVQIIVGFLVQKKSLTTKQAMFVGAIFPLSIALVAVLEALGFD